MGDEQGALSETRGGRLELECERSCHIGENSKYVPGFPASAQTPAKVATIPGKPKILEEAIEFRFGAEFGGQSGENSGAFEKDAEFAFEIV